MNFIINVPAPLFPVLTQIAHSVQKPAEQYLEDFVTESLKQRLYHLRSQNNQLSEAACGFRPNSFRGDRPALSSDIFLQVDPPAGGAPNA